MFQHVQDIVKFFSNRWRYYVGIMCNTAACSCNPKNTITGLFACTENREVAGFLHEFMW